MRRCTLVRIVRASIRQARREHCLRQARPADFRSYVAYAQELCASLRRPPEPDYPYRTKCIIMRWFERGLSGRILWLICDGITRGRFGGGGR